MQEYYHKFYSGELEKPDFSLRCPICGSSGCAPYHGYYTRAALCPINGFYAADFPVMRFKCKSTINKAIRKHVTFSLLPVQLVPYRRIALEFMFLAIWLRLSNGLSLFGAMDIIERELNNLADVGDFICVSGLISWENMIKNACNLLISGSFNMGYITQSKGTVNEDKGVLLQFVEFAIHYRIEKDCHNIRGPDVLSFEFFKSANIFLFGTASQHRK